jgi:hypothetical protein
MSPGPTTFVDVTRADNAIKTVNRANRRAGSPLWLRRMGDAILLEPGLPAGDGLREVTANLSKLLRS